MGLTTDKEMIMAAPAPNKPYTLGEYEKAATVMVYTHNSLIRGDVVVKEAIRVSTWLRTQSAPDFLHIYGAQVVLFAGGPPQSLSFPEYHMATPQVLVFHLAPPAKDPLDYDASEPNRKMEPLTVLVGGFRMNGSVRMATATTLGKHIELAKEVFTSIYDLEISNPALPSLGVMRVPFAMVRGAAVALAARASAPTAAAPATPAA
jgi:hypothetical protein